MDGPYVCPKCKVRRSFVTCGAQRTWVRIGERWSVIIGSSIWAAVFQRDKTREVAMGVCGCAHRFVYDQSKYLGIIVGNGSEGEMIEGQQRFQRVARSVYVMRGHSVWRLSMLWRWSPKSTSVVQSMFRPGRLLLGGRTGWYSLAGTQCGT